MGRGVNSVLSPENGSVMFGGDIRKERVEKVMILVSQLTVMEMRAVIKELTRIHDSIIMANDHKWIK